MRYAWGAIALMALMACEPKIPDSGPDQGVGFGDYQSYAERREAELSGRTGSVIPIGTPISDETVAGATPAVTPAARPAGISDEQDFSAVSGRETIESDAERLAAVRAQYQQVQPTALPGRVGNSGPSVVEFALTTSNRLGEKVHTRARSFSSDRFNRNCAKYVSADLAQQAFLESGGPQRDRKGLDPDGDGFACYWDPTPFRQARASAAPAPVPAQ